jgi:putative membrane protein
VGSIGKNVGFDMMGWIDHMWGFWGMGWGMWFWLLILAGVGYLFYTTRLPTTYRRREEPIEVARMRLARGEITQEEFENVRKTLENSR